MSEKIKKLKNEKLYYDEHPENSVLQAHEWDDVAKMILIIFEEEKTTLTADDMCIVNWAKKRLGV